MNTDLAEAVKEAQEALEQHDIAVAGDEWSFAPISLTVADALRSLLVATEPAPALPNEVREAAERARHARRNLDMARLHDRLTFDAARVPPGEGPFPQWEALPDAVRKAINETDVRTVLLLEATEALLAALAARKRGTP